MWPGPLARKGVHIAAESQLGAFACAVAPGRLPLMPLRLRIKFQKRLDLPGKRRRSDRASQNAKTLAINGPNNSTGGLRRFHERRPSANFPEVGDGLRAIGVI